ncbi:hypothetical protein WJX73_007153 [Symbiochloris irregularis]|uniref:Uncharacterized protein n=1 Tax=Symbiochloris irregularis TaxID=706552 RepID=A0AAW1NJK5_9CHLO
MSGGKSGNIKDDARMAGLCRTEDATLAEMREILEHSTLPPHLRKLYQAVLASKSGQHPPYFELSSFVDNVKELSKNAWRMVQQLTDPFSTPATLERVHAEMQATVTCASRPNNFATAKNTPE